MSTHPLPFCPFLPRHRPGLDWRTMAVHGDERGEAFYLSALEYGQSLWERGLSARAMLCLDRALGADLEGNEPVLASWPLPYAAMAWFLTHTPPEIFMGNPRVHFQHYAGRMNEPRREQRRARAWACWALARRILPSMPGDAKHVIAEPSLDDIAHALEHHGIPGETALWRNVLASAAPSVHFHASHP